LDTHGNNNLNKQIMTNANQKTSEIGMIGLGVMGRNFLLNLADHGFPVAGYDKDINKVNALREEAKERNIQSAGDIREFIDLLRQPRAIIMLVPAGAPVDSVIKDLMELLEPGDLVIDAGNSYFKDTDVRTRTLAAKGLQFLGVGISGGEEGARFGPSIMPGGLKESYERVRPMFEAAAAKVNNSPCVTYLGNGSAGHFVKMVHNGIEYALMQLISETYDIMKRGMGLEDDRIQHMYTDWNNGEMNSYLMEITSDIFNKVDEKTGERVINIILDVARQKGTGMWTSQSAMELQVPIPTIDIAVTMRDMSVFENQREKASQTLTRAVSQFTGDRESYLSQLQDALYTSMIIAYAQGMAVLAAASEKYCYHLDLEAVARIWRGGCIIRSALLEDIMKAFGQRKDLPNLLLDRTLSLRIMEKQEFLRYVVCQTSQLGVPIPAFMSALSYLDAYRSSWLPANLIQAQRDYFGAHTYERVDEKGTFHTEWLKE
jgi:6-phosphogluconate dehydrogenase